MKKVIFDCSTGKTIERELTEEEIKELGEQKEHPTPEPSKEDFQAKKIEELEKQLATCQQSIVELTALAATMGTPTV